MNTAIYNLNESWFYKRNLCLQLMIFALMMFFFVFSGPGMANPSEKGMGKGKGDPLEQEMKGQEKKSHKKKPKFKEGELIVKFKKDVPDKAKDKVHNKHGSKKVKTFGKLRIHHIKLPKGLSVKEAIEKYKSDPNVEYAEPNYGFSLLATPNDPLFNNQWALKNGGRKGNKKGADIDAIKAWTFATGSKNVVVAVIDTGVDYNHEDLAANMWINQSELHGFDGIDDDGNGYVDDIYGIRGDYNPYRSHYSESDPMDYSSGHGTQVAGIIGAVGNNGIGVVGVNWQVQIMACSCGNGSTYIYASAIIKCLEYIADMKNRGINVVAINASWGGATISEALYEAINIYTQNDILFIAAAGNNKWNNWNNDVYRTYPASYELPNIISVAATTAKDEKAKNSNFGSLSVDVGAPGDNNFSTLPGNTYGVWVGWDAFQYTSQAAAHVSGLAALLKSQDPNRDWRSIKNLILTGGDQITSMEGITLSGKRINAYGSLTCSDSPLFKVLQYPITIAHNKANTLSALSINCEFPSGPVTVTTSTEEVVELYDNGLDGDLAADDGIFTAQWTPKGESDYLTFSSPQDQNSYMFLMLSGLIPSAMHLVTGSQI